MSRYRTPSARLVSGRNGAIGCRGASPTYLRLLSDETRKKLEEKRQQGKEPKQ